MKLLSIRIIALMIYAFTSASSVFASEGHVSSGGTPPTRLEFQLTALNTIFSDFSIRDELASASPYTDETIILSITPAPRGVWIIKTNTCKLQVRFITNCSRNSPGCDFSTEKLNSCSKK